MRFGKSKNTPAVYEDVTTGLKKIYKVNSATMYYYRSCKSNNHNINPKLLSGLFATIGKGICFP